MNASQGDEGAIFRPQKADPGWYPIVLEVLARDYPQVSDQAWSTAIREKDRER